MNTQGNLAKPSVVQIKTGSPFFVHAFVDSPERFVQLFRETVSSLPDDDCGLITAKWLPLAVRSPFITLSAKPVLRTDDGRCAGVAMTEKEGAWLTFSGAAFDSVEQDTGRAIIAHELAHVAVFAAIHFDKLDDSERARIQQARSDHERLIEFHEESADTLATSWGFDMAKAHEWVADYLESRGIETT